MTTTLSTRAAFLAFALVTTLSILSGIFTLAQHESIDARLAAEGALVSQPQA